MQAVQYAQIVISLLGFLLALAEKLQGLADMAVSLVQGAQHGRNPLLAGGVLAQLGLQQCLLAPVNNLLLVFGIGVEYCCRIGIVAEIALWSGMVQGHGECLEHSFLCLLHVLRTGQGIAQYRIIVSLAIFMQD